MLQVDIKQSETLSKKSIPTDLIHDGQLCYVKLSDKVHRYVNSNNTVPFYSVEFFPPRNAKSANNLIELLDEYRDGDPYFCDITWHVAGNPGSDTPTSSITIAGAALNYCCMDTMLHIICIGLTKTALHQHLERAKALGIRNILALRGDKHENYETSDFHYASDLVSFIRAEYGNYFTIVVAGYPIPHPESKSRQHDLECLKLKVDAGADFIISQLFFCAEDFIRFVTDCRRIGINVPIIPGICAINNYESLLKFAKLSSVPIPERLLETLEPIKSDVTAVRNYGVHYLVDLCRQLIDANVAPGLHFFTLNQSSIIDVLKALGLWKKANIRYLPWRHAQNYCRINESTRPIFWVNRPKSYIHRSQHWNEFPFGFWTVNFSYQLGSLVNYYDFLETKINKKELDAFFTNQTKVTDIKEIFYSFYSKFNKCSDNKTQKSISSLPWIQKPKVQVLETLFNQYGSYVLSGLLITNYQPRLNALNSEDGEFGWGEKSGYIYQKEYIEFFLNTQYLTKLKANLENAKYVSYNITNRDGTLKLTNWHQQIPITVAWGLFPRYQLIPVYIADHKTFEVWREETYDLFDCWSKHYDMDTIPYQIINKCKDQYLLVSLIDNQFVSNESSFHTVLENLFSF